MSKYSYRFFYEKLGDGLHVEMDTIKSYKKGNRCLPKYHSPEEVEAALVYAVRSYIEDETIDPQKRSTVSKLWDENRAIFVAQLKEHFGLRALEDSNIAAELCEGFEENASIASQWPPSLLNLINYNSAGIFDLTIEDLLFLFTYLGSDEERRKIIEEKLLEAEQLPAAELQKNFASKEMGCWRRIKRWCQEPRPGKREAKDYWSSISKKAKTLDLAGVCLLTLFLTLVQPRDGSESPLDEKAADMIICFKYSLSPNGKDSILTQFADQELKMYSRDLFKKREGK